MQLTVTGKHLDVGEALRDHVETCLSGVFGKYFGNPIEASVVFSRQAHLYRAQVSVHVGRGILLQSQADADAPYAAFDAAADHIAKRLRRYKRRLRDHRRATVETTPAQQYVIAPQPDSEEELADRPDGKPAVIAELTAEIPTLTVSEAVMRLDLADSPAMLFRNRVHGGLNMVYRRPDGNIGWVDPHGSRSSGQGSA